MPKKNYSLEKIIIKLREIEVFSGQGKTIAEAARQAEHVRQLGETIPRLAVFFMID